MYYKIILGQEPWLSLAINDWSLIDSSINLVPIEVTLSKNYSYNYNLSEKYSLYNTTGFVAWNNDFHNFQRLELFGVLKRLGYKLPPLIGKNSQVGINTTIGENTWIQSNCIISNNVTIDHNVYIGMNSSIGPQSRIGKNTWIGQNAVVGSNVEINSNSSLSSKIWIADNVIIGKQVQIDSEKNIYNDMNDFSFSICSGQISGDIVNYK